MDQQFDLQTYLTKGLERIVKDILKATNKNPRESAFIVRFAKAGKTASRRRKFAEDKGWHIPLFLIAGVTSQCNPDCEACSAPHEHTGEEEAETSQLTGEEWQKIFQEAEQLGITCILLFGGEPALRRDVIEAAGRMSNIIFPIFTNATLMDDNYLKLFDEKRNLIPIIDIEGNKEITEVFHKRNQVFGASVTVTKDNFNEVTKDRFLRVLNERGCKAVVFLEYVPVTEDSKDLAISDEERRYLHREIDRLRRESPEMIYISFPGDEKSSEGCMAAGRGFFYINSEGAAQPCPFSPYSDINVRNTSLKHAIRSPLFRQLREGGYLLEDHPGGCILFEKKDQVEKLIK